MRALYTTAVLWLVSVLAKDAAVAIYRHGYTDGAQELRDFMRRELTAVHAACAADRLRAYNQGFTDAMRFYGDTPPEEPAPRVM